MTNNNTYKELKRLIKSKGLSIVDVAEKVGVTYNGLRTSIISNTLPIKKWQILSEILDKDIVDLISIAKEPDPVYRKSKFREDEERELENLKAQIKTLESVVRQQKMFIDQLLKNNQTKEK